MPFYFFHVRDGSETIRDEEGIDLPDIEAARNEARASARGFIAQRVQARETSVGQIIDIADQTGSVLESLTVSDVLN